MDADDPIDPQQTRALARLSPGERIEIARRLLMDALALKEAWLRELHPGEDDAAIARRLRAWRLHGRAELD